MMVRLARHWHSAAVVAAVLLATGGTGAAQGAGGTIDGVVLDESGAVLPGASITLLHPATGFTRTTLTDSAGSFRAPLLPVGVYEVTAALAGFERFVQAGVTLTVGQTATLVIEMRIDGVAEALSVSGAAPVMERTRSSASSTIDEVAIRNLPVNGRNFLEFVLLTPGVTRDVRLGDLSFAGQRGTLNSLLVDGADNNNTSTTCHSDFGRPLETSGERIMQLAARITF